MTNLADHAAIPQGSARRRYLTLLFSDLSDSARLAGAMEAEDFADLLASLGLVYEEVVTKHGGTIVQVQGDGLLASFGYPEAREDDGRRATEAALDLHDRVRRLRPNVLLPGTFLSLHTGIHSGLVLLDKGDAVRGRLGVLGNAVNIAARLSDAAISDEILVSAETLGAETHFFITDVGHILELKGVPEPIKVYAVAGRSSVGTRFEARSKRGLTPFIGRKAELQFLNEILREAIAGELRCVTIVAPPGQGKTRLAEEFLRKLGTFDFQILHGYCESYLSAEPFQPFLQIIRSMCGLDYGVSAAHAAARLQRTLVELEPALAGYRSVLLRALSFGSQAPADNEPNPQGPDSTVAAIAALFDALAANKPLVLFIDDWQWADDATRLVLGAIRSIVGRPIMVLIATRDGAPGDVGLSDARIVSLGPLSTDEAEQTISHLLPGRSGFVVAELREYSGGNPLFVEELCHFAAHHQADRGKGPWQSGRAWLDKLIEARVERLPRDQADLVRTAAVIGNVIPLQVLESITGYRSDHPLVLALAEQDLVYPGEQRGTLRFKHGIARDVIYNAVGQRQRKAMHLQIAEVLRQQVLSGLEEEVYEPLAYHYAAADEKREAAHYAELAGDKAVAASALDRAQIQYRAALANLAEPSGADYQSWMRIAQRLALACVFDPSREQLDVLLQSVTLAVAHDDPQATARTEYWVGYIYYALGESQRAIAHLEVALDHARRIAEAPLIAQIRATLGQACAAACDYERALLLLSGAIDAKRLHGRSSRPAVGFAYTLACKASVLGDQGFFDQAYECFDEALFAVRGAAHEVEGSIQCWRSGVSLWQGCWDEARSSALEAQRLAERVKSLYLYAMSVSLGGYAVWTTQRSDASLQTIVDATSWLENSDREAFISLNYGWLAEGMAAREEWQHARRYAARALMRGRKQDLIGSAMAYRALARASVAGQSRWPAERYLALAMDNAVKRGSRHEVAANQLCAAEIRLALGQGSEAATLLDTAEEAFNAMKMAWHLDALHKVRRCL